MIIKTTATALAPFSSTYTPSLPELLQNLGCSTIITIYKAGKGLFINPKGKEKPSLLSRIFHKVMDVALSNHK